MTPPDVVLPQSGDVYIQFGVRLVIGQVTPAEITYCVRNGRFTGAPRTIPLLSFLNDLAAGRLQKGEIVICPKCGSIMPKLICETCARAKSNAAFAAQQKQFAEVISSNRAPLTLVQAFRPGTNDGTKWHIRRLGADRRHALCGAFFKTMNGAREARFNQLVEFKPICGLCYETLEGILNPEPVA
jgi:hypothetical protein